jgi:hypothetical protein
LTKNEVLVAFSLSLSLGELEVLSGASWEVEERREKCYLGVWVAYEEGRLRSRTTR